MYIRYSDMHIMFARASNIFCFNFLQCFPILAMLVLLSQRFKSSVKEVSLRIEMTISSCQITIILLSK